MGLLNVQSTAPRHGIQIMIAALGFALAAVVCGCSATAPAGLQPAIAPATQVRLKEDRATAAQLELANRDFADRYVMRIATDVDVILQDNPDQAQCRQARDLRAGAAMNLYDIVTEPNPYLQTLNLIVVVTLQKETWADEDVARKVFGERGAVLADTLRAAHKDVTQLAARLFSPSQLDSLDRLISNWHRENPNLRRLSHARFSDFLEPGGSPDEARAQAGGLFTAIDQASASVDDAVQLGQRALYLSKRMPLLLQWQTESSFDQLVTNSPLTQTLSDLHTIATFADHMPATLDAQRKAFLTEIDQRQPALDATVKNIKETVAQADTFSRDTSALLAEAQKTSAALKDLMTQADTIVARYVPPPAPVNTAPAATAASTNPASQGRPFDIQDYTTALKEASQAARDLNTALVSTDKLLDSPSWKTRIDEINSSADGRMHLAADQSHVLMEAVFRNVYIAMGAFLVVLVAARLLSAWLLKVFRISHG